MTDSAADRRADLELEREEAAYRLRVLREVLEHRPTLFLMARYWFARRAWERATFELECDDHAEPSQAPDPELGPERNVGPPVRAVEEPGRVVARVLQHAADQAAQPHRSGPDRDRGGMRP